MSSQLAVICVLDSVVMVTVVDPKVKRGLLENTVDAVENPSIRNSDFVGSTGEIAAVAEPFPAVTVTVPR